MEDSRYRWVIVAAGGLIYDTFASYAWLYIGSWIMGLGAFFIIMLFKPVPAPPPAALQGVAAR